MQIEDIIKKEDVLFLDTSILSPDDVMDAITLFDKNIDRYKSTLEKSIAKIEQDINILENDNIFIIPEVIDEIAEIRKHILSTLKWKKDDHFTVIDKNYHLGNHLVKNLKHKIDELLDESRKSSIDYFDYNLEILHQITCKLTSEMQLKKPIPEHKKIRFTDEKLVAYALYESMFHRRQAAIASEDMHLRLILKAT